MIKTIKEAPDSRFGLKAIQTKLPRNSLSAWLTGVRKTKNLPRWSGENLFGKSFLGSTNQLNWDILGCGYGNLGLVPVQEILPVLAGYRQQLYELRKYRKDLGFPLNLNLRNCALGRDVEFIKLRNVTAAMNQGNILSGFRMPEITDFGGNTYYFYLFLKPN